jgi:hypothetical protein
MKTLPITHPIQGIEHILIDSVIVGFVYAAANALVAALLGPMSRLAPTWDNIAIWTLTGTLLCLSLSSLILRSSWSRNRTMLAVWAALALVRSVGLGIEGALFKPTAAANALVGAVFGVLASLLVAWLAVWLLAPVNQDIGSDAHSSRRGGWGWTWRVLIVGLAYFVFYFIFGAANAFLYTLSFYKNNPQYGLSLPPAGTIFIAQLIRGPLFALGAVFLTQAVKVSRRQLALWLGLLLFVVGGVAPYLEVTFRTMPLGFNLATLTEIFFQNFLTGVVAAYLFGVNQSLARHKE